LHVMHLYLFTTFNPIRAKIEPNVAQMNQPQSPHQCNICEVNLPPHPNPK